MPACNGSSLGSNPDSRQLSKIENGRQKQRNEQHNLARQKIIQKKKFLEKITAPVRKHSSKIRTFINFRKIGLLFILTQKCLTIFVSQFSNSRNTTSLNFANFTKYTLENTKVNFATKGIGRTVLFFARQNLLPNLTASITGG
jgi:hypothetical protein